MLLKILSLTLLLVLSQTASPQARVNQKVVLSPTNSVVWRGEVSGYSATQTALKLAVLAVKRGIKGYPLYLVLDSPGGSIPAGNMFIDFAKTISNLKTITIFSASMAAAIVESLPGERLITQNGELMFHRAYAGVEGQVEVGELETRLAMIKDEVRKMEIINAGRLGLTLDAYKERVRNEMWLDADESLANKAADRVVDIYCTQEMIFRKDEVVLQAFFGIVKFSFSECPLFRVPTDSTDNRAQYRVPDKFNFKIIKPN